MASENTLLSLIPQQDGFNLYRIRKGIFIAGKKVLTISDGRGLKEPQPVKDGDFLFLLSEGKV